MTMRLVVAVLASALALGATAQETHTLKLGGESRSVDVYRPAGETIGVAIVAHGFARSRARHRDLGLALADSGIAAVIPDLPNVMNLWSNGDALVDLEQRLEQGGLPSLTVARDRVVLIGTSAGGLATLLAAAQLQGVAGWIGLDPVDRTGSGATAAARLTSPAVVMLAEPSMCNLLGSGRAIGEALVQRWRTVEIADATHCDFEDPTNNLCQVMCGQSSDGPRSQVRAEIVTTALEMLARRPPRASAGAAAAQELRR